MFCGILPWTWFASSLNESAGVLISGGNLIKKVLFPAEILPIVSVLANMVHFFFGLPILAGFLLYYHRPLTSRRARVVPARRARAAGLTPGFALILSALTVHFRDIRDILSNLLTFWFFATPIIYPYFLFEDPAIRPGTSAGHAAEAEPVHAPGDHLPGDPVLRGARRASEVAARRSARHLDRVLPVRVLRLRSAAGYVCGGSVTWRQRHRSLATSCEDLPPLQPAPAVRDAEERAAVAQPDPQPAAGRNVLGACSDVTFTVPKGRTLGVIGRNGSGKSTLLKLVAGITKPSTRHR